MWETILSTLRDEFADLSDPEQFTRVAVRLLVAIALGAIVGYERERHGKTAGLRTHMLVALGVALLIVSAEQSGVEPADMTRVLQGLFAGIGFLGAGAILKLDEKERDQGPHHRRQHLGDRSHRRGGRARPRGDGRASPPCSPTSSSSLLLKLEQRVERDTRPRTSATLADRRPR